MFAKIIDRLRNIRNIPFKLDEINQTLHKLRFDSDTLVQLAIDEYITKIMASNPRYGDPRRLTKHEYKVYSQGGEDGAIQEIFNRIGITNRFFVEFGVGNGLENNTANLLAQQWSGLWIEANETHVKSIHQGFKKLISGGKLQVLETPVTAENIEGLLSDANVPSDCDLLSIDIDGNDYWVWNSIRKFRPRVIVIEYNAMYPRTQEWIMPYDPGHKHGYEAHFGASIKSLEILGRSKDYNLVGCGFTGANAFFVRKDLAQDHFLEPFTGENHYEPPRYFLVNQQAGHPRTYRSFGGRDTYTNY